MSAEAGTPWRAGRAPERRGDLRRRVLVAALAAFGAVAVAAALARLAELERSTLRELRIAEQRLERRSLMLGEPGASDVLEALESTRDELRVRLVESLEAMRVRPGVTALNFRVDEHVVAGTDATMRLRLALDGRLAHGAALIELLDAVHAAARPWPVETRACLLQRLARSGVQIECAVDVLHWTDLNAPSASAP